MAEFVNLDAAYDADTLTDWYISSVGPEPPEWTDEHIEELLNDFYVIPKDTPAADVAPVKHGHWTEKKSSGIGGIWDYYFVCSVCGGSTPNKAYTVAPDYCPNCGAKMDDKL